MKRILMIALIALAMVGLFAANQTLLLAKATPAGLHATASETMLTANQLYEGGQFTQAGQAYQQLVDQGIADSTLFYNLGNAYFKQGDYGRAVLNYRQAQRLAPRDADIQANLALARNQTADRFEIADDGGFLAQVGDAVGGTFTLNELAMATLGAWILLVLLLILFSTAHRGSGWRKGLQYALVATTVLLAVGMLALGSFLYVDDSRTEGVIVADKADVTSGPGSQYVTEFTLHSGAEVTLLEMRGNWVRLAVPGGELEGWLPASAVEAVGG